MNALMEVNGKRYHNFADAARAELEQKSNIEMYAINGKRVFDPTLADYIIAKDRMGIELANEEFTRIMDEEERNCDEWFDDYRPGLFFWDGVEQIFRRVNDKIIEALN